MSEIEDSETKIIRRTKKYRKKPIVIEALQLRWDTWDEMCEFAGVGKLEDDKPAGVMLPNNQIGINIPTLEGVMTGGEGDYIIKGIKGEMYPIKESIFHETYEKVEDEWSRRIRT